MVRHTLLALLAAVAAACGKGAENAACHTDTDCEDGLRCALLQGGDGAKTEMCVNPNGAWNLSAAPTAAWRNYVVPVGVGGGVTLVLLVMLRASVRARAKRKRSTTTPPPR